MSLTTDIAAGMYIYDRLKSKPKEPPKDGASPRKGGCGCGCCFAIVLWVVIVLCLYYGGYKQGALP